jgi:small subunit ribosomal protein S2
MTIQQLFNAGAHFGFKKSRRHPSVAPYVFTTKDGSDVIDLEQTAAQIERAKEVLDAAGKNGHVVLFVGTKDESARIVRDAAERAEAPYVTNRWIGGMLTNWTEMKKRINRLEVLINEKDSGELERKYTKKERVVIGRETDKLTFNFGGIKDMPKTPDLMVVVDPRADHIAVAEAAEKNIPVLALMGTDNNAELVKYPVVANDSLTDSITLILSELLDAYKAGKAAYVPPKPVEQTDRGERIERRERPARPRGERSERPDRSTQTD